MARETARPSRYRPRPIIEEAIEARLTTVVLGLAQSGCYESIPNLSVRVPEKTGGIEPSSMFGAFVPNPGGYSIQTSGRLSLLRKRIRKLQSDCADYYKRSGP